MEIARRLIDLFVVSVLVDGEIHQGTRYEDYTKPLQPGPVTSGRTKRRPERTSEGARDWRLRVSKCFWAACFPTTSKSHSR